MSTRRICNTCSSQLLNLFRFGFCARATPREIQRSYFRSQKLAISHVRTFAVRNQARYADVRPNGSEQVSHTVTKTRRTFGDTLPEGFLSTEEYKVYERLYGPPLGITRPQDVGYFQDLVRANAEKQVQDFGGNDIFREGEDGHLEKVGHVPRAAPYPEQEEVEDAEFTEDMGGHSDTQLASKTILNNDFQERFDTYVEEVLASGVMSEPTSSAGEVLYDDEAVPIEEDPGEEEEEEEDIQEQAQAEEEDEAAELFEESDNTYTSSDEPRRHPLTAAGKWGPSPSTIQLPKDTLIDPISAIFSEASNKHLAEVAQKVFGGQALPNSTATPSPKMVKENLKQSPIALEASQSHMGEMEANAYLAAIMPGAYATILSSLVEVRKRLGPQWLQDLLMQGDGPRVLDAGAGGAGILAWREMLRSEWELMHPVANLENRRVPFGKSTVVTGSSSLRQRSSALLDNTTFLPRLPDYNPSIDHPSLDQRKGSQRKQYDVILAPYTLWTLQQDHMRKAQVQNLWSLLKPDGGVLIVIEKGVPRGFELVAGAREVLLKHHIASPGETKYENRIDEPAEGRYREKEIGMIVAPCTSHGKCPMYLFAGKSVGRRDYCHFSQRYIRPPFLQRIVGQNHRNHEDIRYSFVAVQRGVDQRQAHGFEQGQTAEDNAFAGYGDEEFAQRGDEFESSTGRTAVDGGAGSISVNPLSFPRILLPPLKKRGHIILDACTPAGRIERWTVPKSYGKRAYNDARKAHWGDLWALGAKTRIARRLRIGGEAAKPHARRRFEADASNPDNIREVGRSAKVEKRHRKERRSKDKKRLSDEIDV
ncbi:MAG: hypothetical protein L6R38_004939 [Xanthoria sp. 2 TBL-2021]|nr:MAG: hypothetical protein L6R38_004939 [Xanthoria sp. 2 TBL-2021]